MEVNVMKKILSETDPRRRAFNDKFKKSVDYYRTKTDIVRGDAVESHANTDGKDYKDVIRKADNRIPSNYHQLIIDQEASYLATTPPDIDLQEDGVTKRVQDTLGDVFGLILNQLVIDASNAGSAWLHYWTDEVDKQKTFKYATVPPNQVTPIYTSDLTPKLKAVRRSYEELNTEDGKNYTIHEYWDDKSCTVFKSVGSDYDTLTALDDRFALLDDSTNNIIGTTNVFDHGWGRIPFIEFVKNRYKRPELDKYKGYIDTYDLLYNGLINDLQDITDVILLLTNFSGTEVKDVKEEIKKNGALKFESMGAGDNSGLDTLKIDIPTEAKELALNLANKKIFKFGQGIDPDDFLVQNNATQPALKMLYSHLELKASQSEQYFRRGVAELVQAILVTLGLNDEGYEVTQAWHRTSIQNNLEQAQMLSYLAPLTSKENVAKANPIVADWKLELEQQKDEAVDDPFEADDDIKRKMEEFKKKFDKDDEGEE